MNLFVKEIDANFEVFDVDWRKEMEAVSSELAKDSAVYLTSYRRLISLQAWRSHLETNISEPSLAFFLEAQNDALTSHVFAALGSWRSALKALRGCIDNVLFCLYYKDHPVELEMWHSGKHKPTFNDLFNYLEQHPARASVPSIDAIPPLRTEYSTLSKAVHASNKSFRMTKDIKTTLLWSTSREAKGKWETRESAVLENINLLLLALFREGLTGAAAAGLRDSVSLAINPSKYAELALHLKVMLHSQ